MKMVRRNRGVIRQRDIGLAATAEHPSLALIDHPLGTAIGSGFNLDLQRHGGEWFAGESVARCYVSILSVGNLGPATDDFDFTPSEHPL